MCAPNCAERRELGFDIDIDDAKISLPQIHERVKTLAAAQSADITAQLRSEGVEVVAGRGELVDSSPAWPHHRIKVTAADGNGQRASTPTSC